MRKAALTIIVGLLGLTSAPAWAGEDLDRSEVIVHRNDDGSVDGCELTFGVMKFDGPRVLFAHAGSFAVLDAARGGRNVGLNLTVWSDGDLRAPKEVWITEGEGGTRALPGAELSADAPYRFFNFAYEAFPEPIDALSTTGRIKIAWRTGDETPETFTVSIAERADLLRDWNACMAALPPV